MENRYDIQRDSDIKLRTREEVLGIFADLKARSGNKGGRAKNPAMTAKARLLEDLNANSIRKEPVHV